jgi:hypothetical protein
MFLSSLLFFLTFSRHFFSIDANPTAESDTHEGILSMTHRSNSTSSSILTKTTTKTKTVTISRATTITLLLSQDNGEHITMPRDTITSSTYLKDSPADTTSTPSTSENILPTGWVGPTSEAMYTIATVPNPQDPL